MTSSKHRTTPSASSPRPYPPDESAVESPTEHENEAPAPMPERQTHIFSREAPPERERIGDILRRVREQRGESLYAISDFLRIRPTFLAALENSHYEEFAADAYVIGFLRTYADYLGLDTKAATDLYRREMAGRRHRPQLNMPKPISEGRAPTVAILFGAMAAALLLYAIWYGISSSSRTEIETEPALPQIAQPSPEPAPTEPSPQTLSSPVETGTKAPLSTPLPSAAKPESLFITDPKASPGISLSSTLPTVPFPAETATKEKDEKKAEKSGAAEKVGEPVKLTPGAAKDQATKPPEKARIVVKATKESWVLITDDQGNTIVDKIMEAGETYSVPNGKGLKLTAGNGEGVTISVDGVDMPKLGADSRLVRDVPLDADRVTPTSE